MLKNRLIPVVLLRHGVIVQSKGFRRYQRLGNPTSIVERLSDWASDELIYLDISPGAGYDLGREDLYQQNRSSIYEILSDVARVCFMPLTVGGGIRSLDDVRGRLRIGADKVTINTAALERPEFIEECAQEFGSQCVVISIDARASGENCWEVCKAGGKVPVGRSPAEWAHEAQERGAGEIFLNSIDRDGAGIGYDLPMTRSVTSRVSIPVIACGGVGEWSHFAEGISEGGAAAVAAANIFNYTEQSVFNAKKALHEAELNVRPPNLRESQLLDSAEGS